MRLTSLALAALLLAPPAQANSYAGMQGRDIRALSPQQVQDLLAGRGMAQALAAELNGWPGPMHVLEHAAALDLTPAQRAGTEALMAVHRAQASALGARIVEAERALDLAFRERRITPAALTAQVEEIGLLQGRLRAEHLQTHLHQTAILTPEQVTRYGELRGYGAEGASQGGNQGGHHRHHRH